MLQVKKISLIEQRHAIGVMMKITLIRVFSLKMFNIALMFLDLNKVAKADKFAADQLEAASGGTVASAAQFTCLEDKLGDLFRRMIITDAFVYTMVTGGWFCFVKFVRGGRRLEYDTDQAAQEAINVMYRQVVTWVATVTSPLMPFLTFCVSNCLMAVEFWALDNVFRPPEHPWSAVKTVASFMTLTFVSMLVSMLPAIVWMTGIRTCGPFEGKRPIDTLEIFLTNLLQEMTCHELKPAQDCHVLSREPCLKRLAAGECEWRVAETEDSFAPIVEHVKLAFDIATSTVFMMAAIGVLGATICESCRPNATRCSVGASELLCKARFDAWLVGVLCLVQIS